MLNISSIEEGILASIVDEPSSLYQILEKIDASSFISPKYQKIFKCFQELIDKEHPIEAGFIEYSKYGFEEEDLNEIFIQTPLPISMTLKLCDTLALEATKRDIQKFSTTTQKIAQGDVESKEEMISQLLQEVDKLILHNEDSSIKSPKDRNDAFWEVFNARKNNPQALLGASSGIEELDDILLGFQNGSLYILGARPAMGKSAIAANSFALSIAKEGKSVAICSHEMPQSQIHERHISSISEVPLRNIKTADVSDKEFLDITKATKDLEKYEIYIEDESIANIDKLVNRVKFLAANCKKPLGGVIVDYLQLQEGNKKENRTIEVSEISRRLKLLAKELNIPVIALSQLNRRIDDRENKRPMLSDLRESGSIEQDADVVMFLYREDVYFKLEEERKVAEAKRKNQTYVSTYVDKPIEEADIIIAKNRDGALGVVKSNFVKNILTFTDKE